MVQCSKQESCSKPDGHTNRCSTWAPQEIVEPYDHQALTPIRRSASNITSRAAQAASERRTPQSAPPAAQQRNLPAAPHRNLFSSDSGLFGSRQLPTSAQSAKQQRSPSLAASSMSTEWYQQQKEDESDDDSTPDLIPVVPRLTAVIVSNGIAKPELQHDGAFVEVGNCTVHMSNGMQHVKVLLDGSNVLIPHYWSTEHAPAVLVGSSLAQQSSSKSLSKSVEKLQADKRVHLNQESHFIVAAFLFGEDSANQLIADWDLDSKEVRTAESISLLATSGNALPTVADPTKNPTHHEARMLLVATLNQRLNQLAKTKIAVKMDEILVKAVLTLNFTFEFVMNQYIYNKINDNIWYKNGGLLAHTPVEVCSNVVRTISLIRSIYQAAKLFGLVAIWERSERLFLDTINDRSHGDKGLVQQIAEQFLIHFNMSIKNQLLFLMVPDEHTYNGTNVYEGQLKAELDNVVDRLELNYINTCKLVAGGDVEILEYNEAMSMNGKVNSSGNVNSNEGSVKKERSGHFHPMRMKGALKTLCWISLVEGTRRGCGRANCKFDHQENKFTADEKLHLLTQVAQEAKSHIKSMLDAYLN
jgi:hypothetical protein